METARARDADSAAEGADATAGAATDREDTAFARSAARRFPTLRE